MTFTTSDGVRHETRVTADTKAEASDAQGRILRELREVGPDAYLRRKQARAHPLDDDPPAPPPPAIDVPTFGQLADLFREEYACPPRMRDGHRYAGMGSWERARQYVKLLENEFGRDLALAEITFDRLRRFKIARLDTPVQQKGWKEARQRSFANVNRTLSLLRRMLGIAKRMKWIAENPFETPVPAHEKLIATGLERERDRVLSPGEEVRLLKQLETPERVISRLAVITLLETGARVGELVRMPKEPADRRRLRWRDIDPRQNTVVLFGAKTEAGERLIGLTPRLKKELSVFKKAIPPDPDELIFGKHSYYRLRDDFRDASAEAGIQNLTIHDLRHTRATRWIQGGISESEVGYLLGHSKKSHVTRRYINPDERTVTRSLEADARFQREHRSSADTRRPPKSKKTRRRDR